MVISSHGPVSPLASYPIVTTEVFPQGLRCASCDREILPGQPFAERAENVTMDDELVVLICVYCQGE